MEESVATRLKLFIDTNDLTSTQFADMCGIPRPTLSQILSGRNKKISDILVGQIHKAFPDLSVVWLLFGEGPVKVGINKQLGGGFNTTGSNSFGHDGGDSSDNRSGYDSLGEKPSDLHEYPGLPDEKSAQNPEMRIEYRADSANSNVSGLKSSNSVSNVRNNQVFESDLKILDLQRQIEQLRQNPRKVLQITIYYDDSTFETFVPKDK